MFDAARASRQEIAQLNQIGNQRVNIVSNKNKKRKRHKHFWKYGATRTDEQDSGVLFLTAEMLQAPIKIARVYCQLTKGGRWLKKEARATIITI